MSENPFEGMEPRPASAAWTPDQLALYERKFNQVIAANRAGDTPGRYQMFEMGGSTWLFDSASGDTWLMIAKGDTAGWKPVYRYERRPPENWR